MKPRSVVPAALLMASLAGCSSVAMENLPSTAEVLERGRYVERLPLAAPDAYHQAVDQRVAELTAAPLTIDAAVEIAMLRTPALQAEYRANKQFGSDIADRLRAASPGDEVIEMRAARAALHKTAQTTTDPAAFADIYVETADTFLDVGAAVRKAYYKAQAAERIGRITRDRLNAAKSAAETANEQYRTGAASRLDQARHYFRYATAQRALAVAETDAIETREVVTRQLGLWGKEIGWRFPDEPLQAPKSDAQIADVEKLAITRRFDVLQQRGSMDLRQKAAEARSEAREAYAKWLVAANGVKQIRETIIPAQKEMLAETQRRYNAMLVGVYDLLDAVSEGLDVEQLHVEAVRDALVAEVDLMQALGGPIPNASKAVAAAGGNQ